MISCGTICRIGRICTGKCCEYLEYNLALAISMARIHYARVREKIPSDLTGWAGYWKRFYNTPKGKGTEEEFVYNYKQYVL